MSEKNGNYEILHSINLNGEYGIVLGENKDAIEGYRYVTWIKNDRGYDQGHYFGNKKQAYVSLLERSASTFQHLHRLKYRLEDEYHKYTSKEEAQNENETEEQEEIEP